MRRRSVFSGMVRVRRLGGKRRPSPRKWTEDSVTAAWFLEDKHRVAAHLARAIVKQLGSHSP